MLTYDDVPTIRHAVLKRLDKEKGVQVCDIRVSEGPDCIVVGILAVLDGFDSLVTRSLFELPPSFDIRHLHNEIDQIAEQYKAARRDFWANGRTMAGVIDRAVIGTGLRGLWAKHA